MSTHPQANDRDPSTDRNPDPGTTAFIGGGNMAHSLIGGMIAGGCAAERIHVAEPRAEARKDLEMSFGVVTHANATDAVAEADNVVLAVKPQIIREVCRALSDSKFPANVLFMSIAAGVRLDQLALWIGGARAGKASGTGIVRVMPNTPALIGAGAIGLCANAHVSALQRNRSEQILEGSGMLRWIEDESLMDTVTALSGSGPAYFFAFVEALEAAAVAQGLPVEVARDLASQTCLGAGRMLRESGESPAALRTKVTSPGGTTAAALESLATDGLADIALRAVAAATRRGGELSGALD